MLTFIVIFFLKSTGRSLFVHDGAQTPHVRLYRGRMPKEHAERVQDQFVVTATKEDLHVAMQRAGPRLYVGGSLTEARLSKMLNIMVGKHIAKQALAHAAFTTELAHIDKPAAAETASNRQARLAANSGKAAARRCVLVNLMEIFSRGLHNVFAS